MRPRVFGKYLIKYFLMIMIIEEMDLYSELIRMSFLGRKIYSLHRHFEEENIRCMKKTLLEEIYYSYLSKRLFRYKSSLQ